MSDKVMTSVYVSRDLYTRAKQLHLNVSAITEIALEQAIDQIMERGDDPSLKFLFFNRPKESRLTLK